MTKLPKGHYLYLHCIPIHFTRNFHMLLFHFQTKSF